MNTRNAALTLSPLSLRTLVFCFSCTGVILIFFLINRQNYLLFHLIVELLSILIAWSLFIIVWNTREIVKNSWILFVGIAYLCIGWLVFLHILSYKGIAAFHIQPEVNTATQLWVASRFLESITLIITPLLFSRRFSHLSISVIYILVTALITYFILVFPVFPDYIVEGSGLSAFLSYSDYTIIASLLLALYFLYKNKHLAQTKTVQFLSIAIIFTAASEVLFTLNTEVSGFIHFLAHVFKVISFYFVYLALIKIGLKDPYELLFKEISDSENRYRQMFETNKAVKLIVDPADGKIVKANESACSYYGYSQEQFDSLYISDINALSSNEVLEEMERAKKKKKLVFSFPHRLANGEIRDVEVYSGPIIYQEKTFLYSIIHDVTERNRVTRELKLYAENLYSIFNSIPNILMLLNIEGRVEMLNHRGLSFLGKEKSETLEKLGGEVFDCINALDGEGCGRNPDCSNCIIRKTVQSSIESGQCHSDIECQMTFLRNDKQEKYDFLISTAVLPHGEEKKVLLSITDITPLKDKEKEVSFQAYLLNHIQDQIIVTDTAGTIIYANDAACKTVNRTKEDLIGKSVETLGENPKMITQKEIIRNTLENGEWQGEVVNYSISGQELIMALRTRLLADSFGNTTAMMGIATNITEQKVISKQLEQAQKMEVMGTLAGGIAHDFNNILSPILGYTEILLEETSDDNTYVTNSLEQIHISAMRASELVKQILTFSRQKETEFKPIKVQIILKEALKLIRSTVPKNITIKQDIDDSCPAVNADVTQVHQVIMNLLTNAYHAIGNDNGIITVTFRQQKQLPADIKQSGQMFSGFVCLEIKDTGSGIAADVLPKIFDPFFTTKEHGKGTGMGLSVAHGIVTKMQGHICVASEAGQGSLFSIYIPIDHQVSSSAIFQDKNDTPTGSEHVLLIDDEEPILKMHQRMLERLGYRVTLRSSPVEALEAFRNAPDTFDLVITDMSMPVMPGDKLASELLKIRPGLPIILSTGFSEKISLPFTKEMGFSAILMKPIIRQELATTIRKVLDNKNNETLFNYRINDQDIITSVSMNWQSFAQENGGTDSCLPANIIGSYLWNHISDPETIHLFKLLLHNVRINKRTVNFPFRCDSPEERRFLHLSLLPGENSSVEFVSQIIKTEKRTPVDLLSSDIERSDTFLKICSMCKKIALSETEWEDIEIASQQTKLFERYPLPQITHGVCDTCYNTVIASLDR